MVDVQLQVVRKEQPALHPREMCQQIVHRLLVQFHHLQVHIFPLQQVLCQHAHPRADFQRGYLLGVRPGIQRRDYALRRSLVHQEVLPQCFFSSYFHPVAYLLGFQSFIVYACRQNRAGI